MDKGEQFRSDLAELNASWNTSEIGSAIPQITRGIRSTTFLAKLIQIQIQITLRKYIYLDPIRLQDINLKYKI